MSLTDSFTNSMSNHDVQNEVDIFCVCVCVAMEENT